MPEKNVYCGSQPLKKGQKYGNMKECLESKQIRRWGLMKVDLKLLQNTKTTLEKNRKERLKLQRDFSTNLALLNKLKKENKEAGPYRKKEIREEYTKLIEEQKVLSEKIKVLRKNIKIPKELQRFMDNE